MLPYDLFCGDMQYILLINFKFFWPVYFQNRSNISGKVDIWPGIVRERTI